jgi:hypothetical protein
LIVVAVQIASTIGMLLDSACKSANTTGRK